jgi:hypothetical protein
MKDLGIGIGIEIATVTENESEIVIVSAIVTVTEEIGIETARETATGIEITTGDRIATTNLITMTERGVLERRTARGCIAGEWTAMLTSFLMVTKDPARLVVDDLTTTRSIAGTRGIPRYAVLPIS